MKMPNDPLFEIFQKQMTKAIMQSDAKSEDVVTNIVEEYMELINKRGMIPKRLCQFIEDDVKEDVTAMIRKTTYGYFSLEEYGKAQGQLVNKLKVRGS